MAKSKSKSKKSKGGSGQHKKSKSAKKHKSGSHKSAKSTKMSASRIGASKHSAGGGGSKFDGNSFEPSNVMGRPKLTKQMVKLMETHGAVKLKSTKEMKAQGYEIEDKHKARQEHLYHGKGPHGKSMVVKMVVLKQCTARYKITLEKFSLKVMKFIGKKPLVECFPKIYEIFLVEHVYYIFMSDCGSKSLYDLVVGKHDISPGKTRKWLHQLVDAVKELQKHGIAHRFIKLKHLLLDSDHVKLVGWSKSVLFWDGHKKKVLMQHKERPARKNNFLPPEAFLHQLYDPSKADVWSIGVVLVALSTRRYPFHVRAKVKFTTQWRQFVKQHSMNPIVRSLCNKIFVLNTKKRLHTRGILQQDYFKVDDKQLVNRSVRGKPFKSDKSSKSGKSTISKGSQSQSYYSDGGAVSTSKASSTSGNSQISKSEVGGTATGSKSDKSSSEPSSYNKSADSKKHDDSKSSKKHSEHPKSKKEGSSKSKPKSAALPSGKSAKSSIKENIKSSNISSKIKSEKSAKSASKTAKSCAKETSGKQSKNDSGAKSAKVAQEKTVGSIRPPSKGFDPEAGLSTVDKLSQQEMQAEEEDAKAEVEQAAEEAAEPVMDEVAKEGGPSEGTADGEIGDAGGETEGEAKAETEMQAPEEGAEQAIPAEVDAEDQQLLGVDEAAASQVMAEAGEGGEGAEGGAAEGEGDAPEANGEPEEGTPDEGGGGEEANGEDGREGGGEEEMAAGAEEGADEGFPQALPKGPLPKGPPPPKGPAPKG